LRWRNRSTREPQFIDWGRDGYSEELRDLVARCVSYKPVDRPGPAALLAECRGRTAGSGAQGQDLARGMRARARGDEDGLDEDSRAWFQEDRFAVNAALAAPEDTVAEDDGYSPAVSD